MNRIGLMGLLGIGKISSVPYVSFVPFPSNGQSRYSGFFDQIQVASKRQRQYNPRKEFADDFNRQRQKLFLAISVADAHMGLFNWFRGKSTSVPKPAATDDSEPDVIPFPAIGMADNPQVCVSVRLTESTLFATLPTGSELRLDFEEFYRVAVRTTDDGDWTPDVFWIVSAGRYTCLIPQGIAGEAELFNHLIRLPGFDKEVMISAISSTEHSEFECWKR